MMTTTTTPPTTRRQRQVLWLVRESLRTRQRPPKIRELLAGLGLPPTDRFAVQGHLRRLARKGLVTRRHNAACAIALVGFAGFLPGGVPAYEAGEAGVRMMHELDQAEGEAK